MFRRIAESPSKSLLVMTLAFVAGVAVHAFDERPSVPVAAAASVGAALLVAAAFLRHLPALRLTSIAVALMAFGLARYEAALPAEGGGVEPPRAVAGYSGTVAEEPAESLRGTALIMERVSFFDGARMVPLSARMELRYRVPLRAAIGDEIAWRCRVHPRDASVREGRSRAVAWSCLPDGAPAVSSVGGAPRNALLWAKRRIRAAAAAVLPEPYSSLLLGLLIGDTGGIPKDVIAAFRTTGTSHVLAVSGYNVHLVAEFAFLLLSAFAVRRRPASYAVAAFLAAFTLMTGAEAPVVRAAVMGGLGLIAGLLGRRGGGATPLAVAAALMLAHDPLIFRHDVGFRLSFAAILGIGALGPPFSRVLALIPEAGGLRKTAAETLAATLATMPMALHDFGMLPLSGPVANLAVVPLVPFVTATGAASAAIGFISAPLALPAALPCAVAARAMLGIVTAIAGAVPALPIRASAWAEAALYGWLGLLWFALTRAPERRAEAVAPEGVEAVTYDL
ncbi:MAG: hypothetical protein RL272_653 [Candidatus Parcubacteria bacterium]